MKLLENFSTIIANRLIELFENENILWIDYQNLSELLNELRK